MITETQCESVCTRTCHVHPHPFNRVYYRFPANKAHSIEVTKNNMQQRKSKLSLQHRILVPIRAQNSIAAFEDEKQHNKIEENHHLDHESKGLEPHCKKPNLFGIDNMAFKLPPRRPLMRYGLLGGKPSYLNRRSTRKNLCRD